MKDKLIFVGDYQLGLRNIRLYANPTDVGGTVKLVPEDSGTTKVIIGIDECRWSDVLAVLLHELYEATLVEHGLRYGQRPFFSDESSNFLFIVTHNQLDEIHTRVAYCLSQCLDDLKKIHQNCHKKKCK